MKKKVRVELICLNIFPLALTIFFIIKAVQNYPNSIAKYVIMAIVLGVISVAILIGTLIGLILERKENKILEKGRMVTAKISKAELVFAVYSCPRVSEKTKVEYNNRYPCADTQYRLSFKFINEKGKTIRKTAFLAPYVTKQELSYLVGKGNIKIKAYKNMIAFTQEMLDDELKEIIQNQKIIKKENQLVNIKFGIHSLSLSKSKKFKNARYTQVDDYNLYVRKNRRVLIAYGSGAAQTSYLCSVVFKTELNGEQVEFTKIVSVRDFSRIQQLQIEKQPLPIIINKDKVYIDYDKLPIV